MSVTPRAFSLVLAMSKHKAPRQTSVARSWLDRAKLVMQTVNFIRVMILAVEWVSAHWPF